MATLTVGTTGEQFSTLAAAVAASHDGDVIQVAAGTYTNDFATITTNITIEGVGGMVNMVANVAPPDGKAILDIKGNVTLYNMAFSGAAVPDGNGAGIRYEGGNLVLDHTYFHNNQDGLLAADDPTGSITITNSEFSQNGVAEGPTSGFTHNLYVGAVGTLTVTNSYFHDVFVGHEIKSRALTTIIENNRIGDGVGGTGSYEIDLPNGGNATVQNNVIEKGPNAQNPFLISFGEEPGVYAGSTLSVANNTVANEDSGASAFVRDVSGGTVSITGNQIFGLSAAQIYSGTGAPTVSGNTILGTEPVLGTSDPFLPVLPFEFGVCYAEGTRILGGSGELAVEQLQPGDTVVTLVGSGQVLRNVKWIGHRRVDLTVHPRPLNVAPVRIARGAIAENVPHRDLLVSPDHALFLDGMLIFARQLINGGTIRQDHTVKAVTYFHVELDAHAILLAEGVAAESYLDTGNRGFFINSGGPLNLHPDLTAKEPGSRVTGSCAPFRVDEPAVWPIWRRLADRAALLGHAGDMPAGITDPGLLLSLSDRPSRPVSIHGGCHVFALPAGLSEVRLVSRAATPPECRPWLDDRRLLGVAVRRIVLRSQDRVEEIPLDHPAFGGGWWQIEGKGNALTRWTDGDAVLPLPPMHRPALLEIHLSWPMLYPHPTKEVPATTVQKRYA